MRGMGDPILSYDLRLIAFVVVWFYRICVHVLPETAPMQGHDDVLIQLANA